MKINIKKTSLLCFIVLSAFAFSFAGMTVHDLDGTAQVQVEGERKWKTLKSGDVIHDNDVIKTGYRTKLDIRVERVNHILIGSNSRALINFNELKKAKSRLSVTLFEGAVLSQITGKVDYTLYTTTASGTAENATFSTIVEEKTARTGFQVLSGNVRVKNLVLKGDIDLKPGGTSIIEANRPPAPAKPLATNHVDVLSKFFGNKYVQKQIKQSGIKPVKASVRNQSVKRRKIRRPGRRYGSLREIEEKLKPQFNMNFIMERLAEDEKIERQYYQPLMQPNKFSSARSFLGVYGGTAMFNGQNYLNFQGRLGLDLGAAQLIARFPFMASETGGIGTGEWTTADAVLEKIEHLFWSHGYQSKIEIELGKLEPVTRAHGLSTEDFVYHLPTAAVQKTGLRMEFGYDPFYMDIIVPNLTGMDILMPSITFDNGLFFLTFCYNLDRDQNKGIHSGDVAYLNRSVDPPSADSARPVQQYELSASWSIFYHPPVLLELHAGFSQIRVAEKGNAGYGVLFPGISYTHGGTKIMGELRSHNNRFISAMYNPFYGEQRASSLPNNQVVPLYDHLVDNGHAKAVRFEIGQALWLGSVINFSYMQNIFATDSTGKRIEVDKKDKIIRFMYGFPEYAMNRLRDLRIYYDQFHGDYFASANLHSRSGLHGIFVLTGTIEMELDGRLIYIDTDGSGQENGVVPCREVSVGFIKNF